MCTINSLRSNLSTLAIGVVLAALLGACAPAREEFAFSSGTWVGEAEGVSLTLTQTGDSHVEGFPYLPGARVQCGPDLEFEHYSGTVRWDWSSGGAHISLTLEDLPLRQSVILRPAWSNPVDWSRIQYWPCGDPDVDTPIVFVREDSSSVPVPR